ncbi:MAG: hypothetical protein MUC49_21420 [Raineya sp.]|jgi:hypothetical protein|nr:hypothetical protein [Raineya sp.]
MIQYNIFPSIRTSKDIHKKYENFFRELHRCAFELVEKKDKQFNEMNDYIIPLIEKIKNNQTQVDGFGIFDTDVSVHIKPSTSDIYYRNDIIGEEPTEEIYKFIYEIKELNDTYRYYLDKPEVGIYYPKKETFFEYEICPRVFLIFANYDSQHGMEIVTRFNFLTYETIQEITQKIEQVTQGTTPQYAYEFEDWFPVAFKNPSIYSYYYMLVSQETTIFGYYFEDKDLEDYGDSWSDEVIIEASTLQVYQLFKDYEDCWYEAESGLPIHWRKSLK